MIVTGTSIEARSDKRGRTLLVLGAITLLFVVLAVVALTQRAAEMAPKFAPHALFPGLPARVNEVADIAVEAKGARFHVHLTKDKGWVVPERNDFPADANAVWQVVAGVANLEAVEPKTARPDWLALLGLGAPDKGGEATRLVLSDAAGKPLADLLVGHTQPTGDAEGRSDVYVRRTNENQAWRARGFLSAKPTVGDWLDKTVMNITRDRIAATTITPAMGAAYSVVRTAKDQPNFQLLDMPKGRELNYPGAADTAATAIVGFDFEDVRPVAEVDFAQAATIVTKTFDGLGITVKVAAKDGAQWASVVAEASTNEKQAEAMAINARAQAWAFKLPQFKADQFLTTRDSLLKAPGDAAAPPTGGPPPSFPGFPGAP